MNNKKSANAYLGDAEVILEECRFSLDRMHWHRVVRKCQEASELAVKGLFKYLGVEYPKAHILGRVFKKEIARHEIFSREDLNRIAFISDSLAFDREVSFYGSPEGGTAAELFDQEDAQEALESAQWLCKKVKEGMRR